MSKELFEALDMLEKEKGINAQELLNNIKTAITVSIKKSCGVDEDNIDIEIDEQTKKFTAYLLKDIVMEVTDEATQISLEDATNKSIKHRLGGRMRIKLDTKQIGRIAALAGKNLIHQSINEAVKAKIAQQYQDKLHEALAAKVLKIDPKTLNAVVELDRNEVTLFRNEQLPNDNLRPGDFVKVYVSDVVNGEKRCIIKITRNNKELVKRLMEKEIPEIFDGIVVIKSISREAGARTKVAVWSNDPNVDPVGACIGPKGARIANILEEIKGEKIDIIKYSEIPEEYIAQALSPSSVESVTIPNPDEKVCRVIVPDNQLSLAIGNKGQNAKLAAKLTGFKIDIKSQSLLDAQALEEERLAEERRLNPPVIEEVVEETTPAPVEVVKETAPAPVEVVKETAPAPVEVVEETAPIQQVKAITPVPVVTTTVSSDLYEEDDFELALAQAMVLDDTDKIEMHI